LLVDEEFFAIKYPRTVAYCAPFLSILSSFKARKKHLPDYKFRKTLLFSTFPLPLMSFVVGGEGNPTGRWSFSLLISFS